MPWTLSQRRRVPIAAMFFGQSLIGNSVLHRRTRSWTVS